MLFAVDGGRCALDVRPTDATKRFWFRPSHYKRNDKRHSLPNKYDTWGVIMNGGENSNDVRLRDSPSNSEYKRRHCGNGGLIGKKMKTATTTTHAKSKLNKV